MKDNSIIQLIAQASHTLAQAMIKMFDGVAEIDLEWLENECDPTQHMTDVLRVLDTASLAGLHFLNCGCIVFFSNEHVYINFCNNQHEELTSDEISRRLIDLKPLHYIDFDVHPIPFRLGEVTNPLKWEKFLENVAGVEFDWEHNNG